MQNIVEYDNELNIYTVYNSILPQILGEGADLDDVVANMVDEAILFATEVSSNSGDFFGIFDEIQRDLIEEITSCGGDKSKVRAVLGS